MEKLSLQDYFDSDRDMVLANLEKDRSPEGAQAVLERAVDRVLVRYVEQCPDARQCAAAQDLMQAVKTSLPLIGAVGEARTWKKTVVAPEKKTPSTRTLVWLIAGGLLVLSTVLAGQLGRGGFAPLAAVQALVPAVLGGGCLFRAGMLAARPPKAAADEGDVRTEFLVDPQKLMHQMRAALLVADNRLDAVGPESAAQRRRQAEEAPQSALPDAQVELLSGLLEIAYARRDAKDADALEMISSIRYYLHGAQVDVVDSDDDNDAWFEFLPSPRPGTLRPALVAGGKLLKKGLAAA